MNRLLLACLLLARAAALFAADGKPADVPARPNILFICTDDQRWDAMGVVQQALGDRGRFPWLRTPNMDRLAREGVRFRNAFVVNALCSPSRASFLTGAYGTRHGVRDNGRGFPETNVTVASLLTAAGYATGSFGKWHMGEQRGKRPGFTTSASFIGQGRYLDCPFEVDGVERPTTGWVDTVTTDFTIDFLRRHRNGPFLAMVGFKTAHDDRRPRPEDRDAYADAETVVPANANHVPPFRQGQAARPVGTRQPLPPYDRRYFETLNGADFNVGRLLDALDELGIADTTMVVFTSDNGYFLGEHTLGDKRFAYEESMRVPLLVRCPWLGRAGRVIDDIALNIDFAPTALDLAGVPLHPRMQGRSWQPLLDGTATDWRQAFYYEYVVDPAYPALPPVQALRTETAKLVVYPGHDEWTELFDLVRDPSETVNLARRPEAADLLARMHQAFRDAQRAAN